MLESMNAWIESVRFAYEVQGVISMRLMFLAQGGPEADVEARLMISEKMAAFADAEMALAKALFAGEGHHGRRRARLCTAAPMRARQQRPPLTHVC